MAIVLALVIVRQGPTALAHPEGPGAIESYLHGLVEGSSITEIQHQQIHRLISKGLLSQLDAWLNAQETAGQMSRDTHLYINALLSLSPPDVSLAAVPADYTGNGNVTKLGQINPQPPNPYYGDNSSTGTLYNGISGYATGTREYALQCNSFGLHIIDVSDPTAPFRVQYIDMSGGVSPPKGRIWREVDIHRDPVSGKTYAYVGAQSNGNLWIVDLSYLSGSDPHAVNSNPIPPAGIADRGRTNYGHTVFVNNGLLFMNTANNGSTLGCQIFDLLQNPFNPPIIASWSGSGRDCHDAVARTNVPGSGGKDLLYSSDGYATRYRILDITNIRSGVMPTLVGETAPVAGIYAHSDWLTDDSRYLYTFEEFNVYDVGVYDVSNPASPIQVKTFQYSGDASQNSRTHNGQVRGNYLLLGYYEAGLRVFDISNPVNPVEVGKYETWRDPDGDGTFNQSITGNFNGVWDVHVFLPSGNVLASDMKSGTFIFRVDPIAPPGAPGGFSATPGNGQVALTWAAASGATGYKVRRGTASGGPYTDVKSNIVGTTFTDTGLTNGTTYFYVVTATNAEGEASSVEASATPTPASTPTTTTLSSSPNPSTFGQSVTFTATVTSGAGVPAGTVTFTEGATVWASGVTVDGAGHAAFSTAALAAGSHIITATFTGTSGWGNSSGTNSGSPHVVNPVGTTVTVTFTSVAAQDGWVLESSETSTAGGSLNATAGTASALRVGDDNKDRQYKAIVAFDTSSIPDGATIISVTLRLRRGTVSGTNPFTTHGAYWADVQTGGFSGSTALETGDFQAVATAVQAASLSNAAANGAWSEGSLNAAGRAAVNKTGTTQVRVYFALDDNDNGRNDYIGYYSGDNSTAANRPQLVVTYQ